MFLLLFGVVINTNVDVTRGMMGLLAWIGNVFGNDFVKLCLIG
jgi:hypothetical protein